MKATPLSRRPRGGASNAAAALLALLLAFAATSAPLSSAGDAAADDSKSKPKRKIPIVSDILDRAKRKKVAEVPEAEAETEEEEEEGPNPNEPVCKSNTEGVLNCEHAPESAAEPMIGVVAADDEVGIDPDGNWGRPNPNIFKCQDLHEECATWAKYKTYDNYGHSDDACAMNSAYMTQFCPLSCGTCEDVYLGHRLSTMLEGGLAVIPFCQDNDFSCRTYAENGECSKNPEYMNMFCGASCGICSEESNKFGVGQMLHKGDPNKGKATSERLAKSVEYMMGTVKRDRKYKNVRDDCLNKVPDCTLWAAHGECDKNPDYMKVMCAPACMSCDFLGDTSETCPGLPESAGPLWKRPGDLNLFFENMVDNVDGKGEYLKYNPTALSRPKRKLDGTPAPFDGEDGPWVVLLDDFLTGKEADRLVNIGHAQGYERSTRTTGAGQSDRTDGRTSMNTWCKEPCLGDPLVAGVVERIAAATKSTPNHSEHLQLLRYEPGQFYGGHHDFIPYQLDQPCGARILTLFLYLNDVEEGGNTSFPQIGVSVKPKKGSAVLWPSVRDEDPMTQDPRTEHEADVVGRGVKFAANAWIHSEDFQTPLGLGCI